MRSVAVLLALLPAALSAAPPREVRVRLDTSLGPVVVAVDVAHAPITAANFLAYVDQHRFDGTSFYRAARRKGTEFGLVQGGINHSYKRTLGPIAHEPTSKTGLRHGDGTLSMARNDPGTAMGDFFITLGPSAYLDASPGRPGYAAFGRVVSGMPVVRRILTGATWPGGYSQMTKGQYLRRPVAIVSARRVR